ncbi:hypothetical protein RF11_08109 [Thelohanellus kitauei]|uniref:Uncharacterized protein n=1 Tax=Thelohanellus kitauei TaxID=669202 RepID=A0A0C2JMG8_THEKT|nr:hypothetical protein RF11_08109 [Thelohanellus kitauei]
MKCISFLPAQYLELDEKMHLFTITLENENIGKFSKFELITSHRSGICDIILKKRKHGALFVSYLVLKSSEHDNKRNPSKSDRGDNPKFLRESEAWECTAIYLSNK